MVSGEFGWTTLFSTQIIACSDCLNKNPSGLGKNTALSTILKARAYTSWEGPMYREPAMGTIRSALRFFSVSTDLSRGSEIADVTISSLQIYTQVKVGYNNHNYYEFLVITKK